MRKTRDPKPEYPILDEAFNGLGYSHGQAMDHRLPDPSWTNLQRVSFLLGYDSGWYDANEELEEARSKELERLGELCRIEQGLRPGEWWEGPSDLDEDDEFEDDEDQDDEEDE
jgi:hypothetical protein